MINKEVETTVMPGEDNMDCKNLELDMTNTSQHEDLWEDDIKRSFEETD